ncbi:MAG TPA: carboxypeptidase-like regulatory domain-containing protein [Mucilaginibacter sp.]
MILIKSIAIEKPCAQSWQQMTQQNNGRYCGQCSKTVVDFTKMTDAEIIHYMSSRNHICGRFDTQQLDKLNQSLRYNRKSFLNWKGWSVAAMILGFSQYVNADIRPTIKIEQSPYQNKHEPVIDSSIIVKGRIIAQEDGQPVPGTTIKIRGTNEGTVTNINGEFKIEVRSTSDTLVASFIGYKSEEVSINQLTTSNNTIVFKSITNSQIINPVGVIFVRRPFYARAWYKLKYAIRSIFH